ncbi:unnamed protein product [Arabis nemorensis]|uniref:Uncharacterized protein n=1 Tax=Arabis nemorensis TaxID=586526 RepID=A0A565C967_9BRAS|nr:unnamed protein product [Arabis nemorensis]
MKVCCVDQNEDIKRDIKFSHGGESSLNRHDDFDANDDEREEKERETHGLEKRLSPNAVVLTDFVVLASVDFVIVEVFEEFCYGLTCDYEDD